MVVLSSMRRLLLFLIPLLIIAGCATPQDSPEEQVDRDAGDVASASSSVDVVPDEIGLTLINPVDTERITRPELILSALAEEGELVALEVALVSGPYVVGVSDSELEIVDLAEIPRAERAYRLPLSQESVSVSLPRGLVDGATYVFEVRGELEDGRMTEATLVETELDLRLPLPEISSLRRTVDSTPLLEVDPEYEGEAFRFSVFEQGARVAEVATTAHSVSIDRTLAAGTYQVSAQAISSEGFLTRSGSWAELEVLEDAAPLAVWPVDTATLGSRVGFSWEPLGGAAAYEVRFRSEGSTSWQPLNEVAESYAAVPVLLQTGSEYEWQVRARNDEGRWYSWSRTAGFSVGDFELGFLPVIPRGESVTFRQGFEAGSSDEQPVREITLTHGFEMTVHPLTNSEVLQLIEFGVRVGWFEVDPTGVWIRTGNEEIPVLGLIEMDYGEQFGLAFEEGSIVLVEGYENHPAVGVSWAGARAFSWLLSAAEGRAAFVDPNGVLSAPVRVSVAEGAYRLPTEAEWEFAARGQSERLLPWGGALTGRAANYFRSGDPFEDFVEPFTASGGPTAPVGFYDGAVRDGLRTIDNASPFGIRDLVGNVWEWTLDRYDPDYYTTGQNVDPSGPAEAFVGNDSGPAFVASALDPDQRAVRGTAWNSRATDVRLTNRGRYSQTGRSYSIGVRLIRLLSP